MGAWGTGIFANDVASDVRAQYRELIADGTSGSAATKKILEDWAPAVHDPDDGPEIWLALAAAQHQLGRLEMRVQSKALKMIDGGAALAPWEAEGDKSLIRQRKAALARLRAKLVSPQAEAKKAPRRRPKLYYDEHKWPVGQVYAYQLLSGRYVLLHVHACKHHRQIGYQPTFLVLDWIGAKIPDAATVRQLKYQFDKNDFWGDDFELLFHTYRRRDSELPVGRLKSVCRKPRPKRWPSAYLYERHWNQVDEFLEEKLGWS